MVGYAQEAKAYRLYDIELRKVFIKRDVIFVENKYMGAKGRVESDLFLIKNQTTVEPNNEKEQKIISQSEETTEKEEIITSPAAETKSNQGWLNNNTKKPGRSKIIRTGKPGRPRKIYNSVNLVTNNVTIPSSVKEISSNHHAKQWIAARNKEYDSLVENNTWSVVDLPSNQRAIASKWVYDLKTGKDGQIERFKARLVAKGCSQKYGLN